MMLYIVRKVLATLVEFSNIGDVASSAMQQHKIFITEIGVAKTAVDKYFKRLERPFLICWRKESPHILNHS